MAWQLATVSLDTAYDDQDETLEQVIDRVTRGTDITGNFTGVSPNGHDIVTYVGPADQLAAMIRKHYNGGIELTAADLAVHGLAEVTIDIGIDPGWKQSGTDIAYQEVLEAVGAFCRDVSEDPRELAIKVAVVLGLARDEDEARFAYYA